MMNGYEVCTLIILCLFELSALILYTSFVNSVLESADDESVMVFFIRVAHTLGKVFSLNKSRQKRELARFIRERKEIERLLQRYQYFVEANRTLNLGSHKKPPDEDDQRYHDEVKINLANLPWAVYQQVQSLADSTAETLGNPWIKQYLFNCKGRHQKFDRNECAIRLGCCAASCGCCSTPGRKLDDDLDNVPGGLFMRMAIKKYLSLSHCSVDCPCCIQRRGFRVQAASDEVESSKN